MKIYLSIFIYLLSACVTSEDKITENILPQAVFITILKEIHLAEVTFEINKSKGMENAKNELANAYFDIYKENKISEESFKKTLNYYSENPEKLNQIYTNVLEQLTNERSKLDQQ